MRPTTYAACAVAALALSAGACAAALATTAAAARLLAHCRCEREALAARLSPEHCATRPAPVISTATGY